MALEKNGPWLTDTTGASEVLTLSVVHAVADDGGAGVQIASAFYGEDAAGQPLAATVSEDRQSVTLTTRHGVNALTVHFVAASNAAATAQLSQDGSVLLETTLDGHTGDGVLMIEGT